MASGMRIKRVMGYLAVFGLVCGLSMVYITAQPDAPALRCEVDDLLAAQAELSAGLAAFESDVMADAPEALATLYTVGAAYQEWALACGYIPADIGERRVGTDVETILIALESVDGDPLNGQLLYNNEIVAADGELLGCVGCHMNEIIAPLTEGTWTRWDEIRRFEPQFEAYTFEQYTVESIIHPWDYIVPGYPENTMPNNFGDRLSYQDLADLLVYLESQDQFLD